VVYEGVHLDWRGKLESVEERSVDQQKDQFPLGIRILEPLSKGHKYAGMTGPLSTLLC
jgi:hypothetical protein